MRIAIVEDNPADAAVVQNYIERYSKENDRMVYIHTFTDSLTFISDYKCNFDVVFLDIKMPNLNGMDVGKHLREFDKRVCLFFVTSLAQYAIKGYEVNAMDYLLKPLEYYNFAQKFRKAEQFLATNKQKYLTIKTNEYTLKLSTTEIVYIEKYKNYLIYHTPDAQYEVRGTINEAIKELESYGFGECTHGCIVNFKYVTSFNADTVQIEKQVLPLSRRDRKKFVDSLIAFCGEGASNAN